MATTAPKYEGTLYELQRLQENADRRNTVFEVAKQEKSELANLQTKVEQLKERRDKLRGRLNNGPHKIIQEHLSKARGRSSNKDYTDNQKQAILTAVQLLHKRKLADLCDAYRLTGISVASQEAKRTCFRCDTFFKSRFYEPYYVEVELKENNLKIHKHTVPYFIPMDKISQDYLNTDIKKFFMVISEYLNAFVARREQVLLCQEQYGERLAGEISCSPAHDFIHLKSKDEGVIVKLTYDKLTQMLPSAVELHSEGKKTTASTRALHSKEKHFKEAYLHQAFGEAFT